MPPAQPRSVPRSKASALSAAPLESSTARTRAAAVEATGAGTADLCEVACVDEAKVARARHLAPPKAALATLAEMFKALGDPTRLRILTMLAREELCVCDLATLTDVSESAVSHSLRTLRQLRLVRYRKAGKIAYYSLDDEHVSRMISEGLTHVGEAGRGPSESAVLR